MLGISREVTEEALDVKKSTGSFELVEGSKEVLIDLRTTEGKAVCVGTMLSSE